MAGRATKVVGKAVLYSKDMKPHVVVPLSYLCLHAI